MIHVFCYTIFHMIDNLILYIPVILSGLIVGSFLNAAIYRTKTGMSVLKGRSKCTHCNTVLTWRELIPVVSFALQKGRCVSCKKKISWQYPLVEMFTAIAYVLVASADPAFQYATISFHTVIQWVITAVLIFIFVYDLRYYEILDGSTLIPAVIFFVISVGFGWQPVWNTLAGIAIGSAFFWVQLIVSRGKWVGGGDVRMGFLMGAILGWPGILVSLFISYVSGAFVGLCLIVLKNRSLKSRTPFGTYLSVGTFVAMVWGERLLGWYMELL